MASSGNDKQQRENEEVELLVHNKLQKHIEDTIHINERLIKITLKLEKRLNITGEYASDISKPQLVEENFYVKIRKRIDYLPPQDYTFIIGDLNARIASELVPDMSKRFNDNTINDNGEILVNFCLQNSLRINNKFSHHP